MPLQDWTAQAHNPTILLLKDIKTTLNGLSVDADRSRVEAATATMELGTVRAELARLEGTGKDGRIIPDSTAGKSTPRTGEYIQAEKRKRNEKEEAQERKKRDFMKENGRRMGKKRSSNEKADG
ncbi:unnamed protein product [Tuber aestivum]|uniref:Uncharacterized protein n=1 Tax=Tuber aestivum TaxID=59557 RepID=A0A292PRQ0_9PEZI|nr:unnamed protein product [Tuber aestivum]